jgi:hypothetical protein
MDYAQFFSYARAAQRLVFPDEPVIAGFDCAAEQPAWPG